MGGDAELAHDAQRVRPAGSEVFRLRCDSRKLRELTGFQSQVDLREGLSRTIAWFTEPDNLKAYKADIYNV
ncbi:hypothetical protein [Methylogaea oryzae]|nr:hypothetical protein [Methylogaea oryzae]